MHDPAGTRDGGNVMADSRGRKSSWVLVALALVVLIGWLAINLVAGSPNTP